MSSSCKLIHSDHLNMTILVDTEVTCRPPNLASLSDFFSKLLISDLYGMCNMAAEEHLSRIIGLLYTTRIAKLSSFMFWA